MADKVIRRQFRGCLKENAKEGTRLCMAAAEAEKEVRRLIQDGSLLTASVYYHENMCFLYYEALKEDVDPADFFKSLEDFLEPWPEEGGKTCWAPMYSIYWHSVPQDVDSWMEGRKGKKNRIGRIAFLYPEKMFSYTYWHQAIVEEGLLKGDQYQFISLHENILFSYFEEPKNMVNITGMDKASEVIDKWLAVNPESHFDREKAGGSNFILIEQLLSIAAGDDLVIR